MKSYAIILMISFLSGLTTLLGVWMALRLRKSKNLIVAGLGFSTGIMLLISFLGLLPASVYLTEAWKANIALALGFLVVLLLDFALPHMHVVHERKNSRIVSVALMVTLGLMIHDFPEGFATASSFIYTPTLGFLVAVSIALHNIPEQFAVAVPLVLTKRKSFLYRMAFLSALSEPAGAVIGILAASLLPALYPFFLAFAAGAMIFVSLDELVPLALTYKRPRFFIIGIGASIWIYIMLSAIF